MKKINAPDVVTMVEKYLTSFVSFQDKSYSFVCALWSVFTHAWQEFDTIPYMVITAYTKRSGKSLLAECIGFAGSNTLSSAGITPAALRGKIEAEHPTIYVDEAEILNSEGAGQMRQMLNTGYRRGQKYSNNDGDFDTFCPKCFVLIGDVNDTLRDRSIIIFMRRGDAPTRSTYTMRKDAGEVLREEVSEIVTQYRAAISDAYMEQVQDGLTFFESSRDSEIWACIFALCAVFCPDRMTELRRAAVDIATQKTQEAHNISELKVKEQDAERNEYAERLLRDVYAVIGNRKGIAVSELLPALKDIDIAPWRKYKGRGLTYDDIGWLLDAFGARGELGEIRQASVKVVSKPMRLAKGKVVRAYAKEDIATVAKKASIKL